MTTAEHRLAQVERELSDLKDEYNDFAYIVSHDLNAPMRAIEGFAELILKEHANSFDEKTQKHFTHILKGAEDTKHILTALLDYSRLNTQQEPFSEVRCSDVMLSTKEKLALLIEKTKAQIQEENLPTIYAKPSQIDRLFYELIHNALLYCAENTTPKINIIGSDTPEHWCFMIKDNGIGIKESLTEKIFKVLRRAVSNKQYPGRQGMGLAIAKKILQQHQGKIWLQSVPNEGSIFYFTIAKGLKNE